MTSNAPALPIDLRAVGVFWGEAFDLTNVHSDSALFGEQSESGLFPPPFQYSANRAEATRVAHEVLTGERTEFVTDRADFGEGAGLPADGDMSIICDGDGRPVALISDTNVSVRPSPHDPRRQVVVETFEVLFPEQ